MVRHFKQKDIKEMEKRFRVHFVNSLPGFKSANLIGTTDNMDNTNLAVLSSVIHIGSDPSLLGFISRPDTVKRHSLENIRQIKYYTINHINNAIYKSAHQTSARYPKEISEFDSCGLQPEYHQDFPAPYVKASRIQIGLEMKEEHRIKSNGTILIIGMIKEVHLKDVLISPDGYIDIEAAGSLLLSGSDSYHRSERLARLSYAKPDREIEEIK